MKDTRRGKGGYNWYENTRGRRIQEEEELHNGIRGSEEYKGMKDTRGRRNTMGRRIQGGGGIYRRGEVQCVGN